MHAQEPQTCETAAARQAGGKYVRVSHVNARSARASGCAGLSKPASGSDIPF